jgi:dTDP-4-amino-4,6-dideoxygalactose transaminase
MKFVDLEFENKNSFELVKKSFQSIENSGKYLLGENLEKFEINFSKDQGYNYAIGVKNATDALYMSMVALNAKEKTVIVPGFGAYPTVVAAIQANAKKIIAAPVDESLTICLDHVEVPKESIIIPVNLFGNECDLNKIREIADSTNSVILEDCAQSTGIPNQKKATISIHSFYPTKPLGCRGDGGAVLTNDEELFKRIKKSRFYGLNEIGEIDCWGFNSRMDEWQSSFLSEKLKFYRNHNETRRQNAQKYSNHFDSTIRWTKNCVYHQFVILCANRNEIKEKFDVAGVPTMIHYPKMLKDMPYLKDLIQFVECKNVANHVLSIPVGPHLSEEDILKICEMLSSIKGEIIEFQEIKFS